MNVLKLATAGSVDDGKSTLIGRLLYDTKSVPKDKLDAVRVVSERKGLQYPDLSLLTDGLVAEREQGITIDVAHIYFKTARRKFILADTPGHIEYTRNMITGASNAEVSLILIDARKGVLEQTYRHFFITKLLNIQNVVVCINKMDLADFSEKVFNQIADDFRKVTEKADFAEKGNIYFVPLSALWGDNVANKSEKMAWYKGETLLEILEKIQPENEAVEKSFRFPVQLAVRKDNADFNDYRAYAGKIASGKISKNDEIIITVTRK